MPVKQVEEKELPGVGKRFSFDSDGHEIIVVIENNGRRELFVRDDPDEDARELLTLTDQEARVLGTILEGVYFQPVADEPVED